MVGHHISNMVHRAKPSSQLLLGAREFLILVIVIHRVIEFVVDISRDVRGKSSSYFSWGPPIVLLL